MAAICFFSGIVVGNVAANRARCREIALSVAGALYGGSLSPDSSSHSFLSPEASSWFSRRKSKLGAPSEYRIIDIQQGPFGLPTIVFVKVTRRQKAYVEEMTMQGVGFVDAIDGVG